MQTFLPYPDFAASATVLDTKRLGKQRVETLQILRALHCEDYGWRSHPAVTMWRGCTAALVAYGGAVVESWVARGFGDTTLPQIAEFVAPGRPRRQSALPASELPPWLGDDALHRSHRSALLRKDPEHYRPHFGDEADDLDYHWPEPPAPAISGGTVTAWVVRPASEDLVEAFAERALVGLPVPDLPPSGRRLRVHRDVDRFTELVEGDRVVVPTDTGLLLGEVGGAPDAAAVPAGLAVARGVRWLRRVERRELRFPAALQAPATVFPLRDEPRLAS